MLHYLYYKLYQATLKGSLRDIVNFAAPVYFAGLMTINLLVIYILLVKTDVLPYIFTNAKQAGWFAVALIILSFIYFGKNRREVILKRYSDEPSEKRIRGNIIVGIYVGLSFLSIFAIGLYKPGKL